MAGAYCFPKAARLRQRREFLSVQQRGRRYHSLHFVLIRASGSAGGARLGITASKRVGNAVVRTRMKRLVRETFRTQRMGVEREADLVLIVKEGAPLVAPAHLREELAALFVSAGVL